MVASSKAGSGQDSAVVSDIVCRLVEIQIRVGGGQ